MFAKVIIVTIAGMLAASPARAFRIAKADFARFAGVLNCGGESSDYCAGAEDGFVMQGLSGEGEMPDPASPELTKGGRIVVGFLEGKPFSWPRYAVDFPAARWKWILLNEVSTTDQNHVVLTQWRNAGADLEFVKAFPRVFPLALGETFVQSKAALPDGSLLVILKGEGSDAGINLQDYRMVRLTSASGMEEVYRKTNRSEIPVQKILERINNDEAVDPVTDSLLTCEVVKGKKAPSGGPLIRFVKSRTQVLYTKSGPVETPLGKEEELVDIWKKIRRAR
jgi:hypothetical protein